MYTLVEVWKRVYGETENKQVKYIVCPTDPLMITHMCFKNSNMT